MEDDVDRALKGAAHDLWEQGLADRSLPLFARLRLLERHLKTLGFVEGAELVQDARAAMCFAASRIEQVSSIARAGMGMDAGQVMVLGAMAIADCADAARSLRDGIESLDAAR